MKARLKFRNSEGACTDAWSNKGSIPLGDGGPLDDLASCVTGDNLSDFHPMDGDQ